MKFFFLFSGNFRELYEYLQESTELISKNSNILDNVLDVLNFQEYSLGALYILAAKVADITVNKFFEITKMQCWFFVLSTKNEDPEPTIERVKQFVNVCNGEQVRNATQTCEWNLIRQ